MTNPHSIPHAPGAHPAERFAEPAHESRHGRPPSRSGGQEPDPLDERRASPPGRRSGDDGAGGEPGAPGTATAQDAGGTGLLRGAGAGLAGAVRAHPVGTALTAAGIALLLSPRIERKDARAAARRVRRAGGRALEEGGERVTAAQERLSQSAGEMLAGVQDTAADEGADGAGPEQAHADGPRADDTPAQRARSGKAPHDADAQGDGRRQAPGEDGSGQESDAEDAAFGAQARAQAAAARRRLRDATEQAAERAAEAVRDTGEQVGERAGGALHDGARSARAAIREHPLAAGAVAFALGAAAGAALPRSGIEERRLGALSERLMARGEELWHRERELAAGALQGALDEAGAIARNATAAARGSGGHRRR